MSERKQKTRQVGNGEGSLFLNSKLNRWQYAYYNTKGRRDTITQKKNESKKEFIKKVTDIKSKLNNGTYIEKSKDTFIDILETYSKQKYNDGIVSSSSYLREQATINQIKKTCNNFINKPIQRIVVEDIEKAKTEIRRYSNESITKIWGLLFKTFQIAYSRRKIPFNIMNDETLKKPISIKEDKEIKALTTEEETKLINILNNQEKDHKYRNIILLQLYTGMRIGEVMALSKDCINLENNTITVYRTLTKDSNNNVIMGEHTKTYKKTTGVDKGKRTFPLSERALQVIKDILSQKRTNIQGMLFWDYKKGNYITGSEINSYLKRINKKYNIVAGSIHTHRLRHTFITRCVERDMNIKVIQSLVGHVKGSSITTDIYTSISNDFMVEELKKIK